MSLPRIVIGIVMALAIIAVAAAAGWWFFVREDNELATSAPEIPSDLVDSGTPGATPASGDGSGLTFVIIADRSEAAYFADEHTAERLNCVYWIDGKYVPEALEAFNYMLRDWREDLIKPIDPATIDIMSATHGLLGCSDPFDVVSGYRCPKTNAMLRERKAPIKAVLLDQSFAAGIGNWIADEVLYQAGIAPKRPASTLSREEARRLRGKIRGVIGRAVGAGSDSDRFPRWWLFHRRWGHRRGGPPATTVRGEHIRHETVAGRTTAWVPSAQR